MSTIVDQPSLAPTRKVAAAGWGGMVAAPIFTLAMGSDLIQWGWSFVSATPMPDKPAMAIATCLGGAVAFGFAYMRKSRTTE